VNAMTASAALEANSIFFIKVTPQSF